MEAYTYSARLEKVCYSDHLLLFQKTFRTHFSYLMILSVFVVHVHPRAGAGYVRVDMAPDPASTPMDATVYFRCRKCRQLLFTDSDVLQHELGEGSGLSNDTSEERQARRSSTKKEEEEQPIDGVTEGSKASKMT